MISEIEKMELSKELQEFRFGIKTHVDAIQQYINIWAKDGESDYTSINFDVRYKIEKIILDTVTCYKDGQAQDDKQDSQNPFFNAILRRFYKKLTKK